MVINIDKCMMLQHAEIGDDDSVIEMFYYGWFANTYIYDE